MALQHFYSRVPAKVSMFNKADGFDTFACSKGLDRAVIESAVASVYNYKPTKEESELIRTGKLKPIYFQYTDKEGRLLQSCVSFLPLDYTGERTCYMVHTLVMTEEEKEKILRSDGVASCNPDLFVKDLSGFDLTSYQSSPDSEYPTLEYTTVPADDPESLLDSYHPDMLKRLIFCLLNICCGKGKTVYISLPGSAGDGSANMLKLMNCILQIFPFAMRAALPFATQVSDASKYSAFKIKGVEEYFGEIAGSKGIVLHFGPRICLGLPDDVVRTESFVVEFFYSLLTNKALRKEYLWFMNHAVELQPDLAAMNLKTLKELTLMFCQCSGMYDERKLLPGDASVLEFVNAYDKHRHALSDEYRAMAMTCLKRYPENHNAIPSKIFTKLTKIYNDEPPASQHLMMNTFLELIHTDAMRDKLFNFIKSRYNTCPADMQKKILDDLGRVYYGGFLRQQILEFFITVYPEVDEDSRTMIFEKLLLTIRTEAIRPLLIQFVSAYYDGLSRVQKKQLYETYAEMLPEADALAKELTALMETLLAGETEEQRSAMAQVFCKAVERNQRCNNHTILPMICGGDYPFFKEILREKVFGAWAKRAIVSEYMSYMFSGGLPEGIAQTAVAVEKGQDPADEKFRQQILTAAEPLMTTTPLMTLLASEKAASELGTSGSELRKFGQYWCKEQIRPAVCATLTRAFAEDGALDALRHCKYVQSAPDYGLIETYYKMEKALKAQDMETFFKLDMPLKYMKRALYLLKAAYADGLAAAALKLRLALLEKRVPDCEDLFNSLREEGEQFEADTMAIDDLLELADQALWNTEDKSWVESSDLSSLLKHYLTVNKRRAENYLREKSMKNLDDVLTNVIVSVLPTGGFFSKLFKK